MRQYIIKKLVSLLAIYALMTEASKKTKSKVQEGSELQRIPYIYYFAQFGEL